MLPSVTVRSQGFYRSVPHPHNRSSCAILHTCSRASGLQPNQWSWACIILELITYGEPCIRGVAIVQQDTMQCTRLHAHMINKITSNVVAAATVAIALSKPQQYKLAYTTRRENGHTQHHNKPIHLYCIHRVCTATGNAAAADIFCTHSIHDMQ